jgi:hypothetical protein
MTQQVVWLTRLRWLLLVSALILLVWSLVLQAWVSTVTAALLITSQVLSFRYERRAARRRQPAP